MAFSFSFVPDKIGGRPAWLALRNLPSPNELICPLCSNPMCFVLQIYSPLSEKSDCFHRMLFLFMCRNGKCHHQADSTPFCVFRSQLPRDNCYYSFEPPKNESPQWETLKSMFEKNSLPWAGKYSSLCPTCGCKANKTCSKCKTVCYCSKVHQVLDWKRHKSECGSKCESRCDAMKLLFERNTFLLPEYRLCSEPADDRSDDDVNEESDSEISELEIQNDNETKALESIAKKETKEEARFRKFKEVMKSAPDQVIRFQRGGNPIWLSESPPIVEECEVCGAERIFEFQVTPQLLCHLQLDRVDELSPDFGSLYIFTCSNSCPLPRKRINIGNTEQRCSSQLDDEEYLIEYQREVVIRQMVP
ncbi:unnamed protein product [Heterobilharzia americana]|nr:unnamed protein product [Heterobilharzia americana]